MRYLFILALININKIAICQTFISGTCIIGGIKDNHIILAADSKEVQTLIGKDGVVKRDVVSVCKIQKEHGFYYAIAGFSTITAQNKIKEACKYSGSFQELLNNLNRIVVPIVTDTLKLLKTSKSDRYRKMNKSFIQILVTYFENHKAELRLVVFQLADTTNVIVKIGTATRENGVLGADEIWDQVTSPDTWNSNYLLNVKVLMERAVKLHPTSVGDPIDILEVWENRIKWFYRKNSCPL